MIVELEITREEMERARDASIAAGEPGIVLGAIPAGARIVRGPNVLEMVLSGKTSIAYETADV